MHFNIVRHPPPLLDPSDTDEAITDLMPIIDWLSQADILHAQGLAKQAANAMVEVLLAYQALPKRSPVHAAFSVYVSRNAFRAAPQPRSLRQSVIELPGEETPL